MGCNGSKTQAAAGAAATPAQTQQMLEGDFKITLERTADAQILGLSLCAMASEPRVLGVEAVKEEGLVPDFIKANANATEQHVVQGDRIIAVNGVTGDAEKMKAELDQKIIVLTIQRAKQETTAVAAEPPQPEQPPSAPQPELAAVGAAETREKKAEALPAVAFAPVEPVAPVAPVEPEAETKAEAVAVSSAAEAAVAVVDATAEKSEETREPARTEDTGAATESLPAEPEVETPAVEPSPAGLSAMATADASKNTEMEVTELQVLDGITVEDEKEQRLCKMAMC